MKVRKKGEGDADYEIILRCQRGDVEAFEEVVRKYQKKVFNIAYRMIGDYNEAAEVAQDAFVAAYKGIKGFKGNARFFTWLYTIVINLTKNRLKQIKMRSYHEPISLDNQAAANQAQVKRGSVSDNGSVHKKLEREELEQKVQSCIGALENEFREVIVLRDIQGFAYEEISAMLNIADGTVKSRLHRAREAVRDCLKKTIGAL